MFKIHNSKGCVLRFQAPARDYQQMSVVTVCSQAHNTLSALFQFIAHLMHVYAQDSLLCLGHNFFHGCFYDYCNLRKWNTHSEIQAIKSIKPQMNFYSLPCCRYSACFQSHYNFMNNVDVILMSEDMG